MDFPESKRERMGEPDYYHKLSEDELDFISKFNEEYVNGSFLGKNGIEYCEDDMYATKTQRNELEREQGAAKRDLLSWSRRTKRKNPKIVTDKAFEYAHYLYAVTGDESYLIREHTDLQNNTDDEGWERF